MDLRHIFNSAEALRFGHWLGRTMPAGLGFRLADGFTRALARRRDSALMRTLQDNLRMAKAIGFYGRGEDRKIGTPFDVKSEVCRLCGGCLYVCPACQLRCTYTEPEHAVCGGCAQSAQLLENESLQTGCVR